MRASERPLRIVSVLQVVHILCVCELITCIWKEEAAASALTAFGREGFYVSAGLIDPAISELGNCELRAGDMLMMRLEKSGDDDFSSRLLLMIQTRLFI
jgi:hypothetical protein